MQEATYSPGPGRRPVQRDGDLVCDICVIGAGSAGLSVAAGAVQMGASVVLVEKGEMGGECLNSGCVPSKAIIAAAAKAHLPRTSAAFGVTLGPAAVDHQQVHDHIASVIAAIAPHDSVERFEGLGVDVIKASARFVDPRVVEAGGRRIRARRFVIATGSRPAVPSVPGLADSGFLTNETIFTLTALPADLLIMGGGPIGVEMAQAFRRLGSTVTLIEKETILSRDDPQAVAVVRDALIADGVAILEGQGVASVSRSGDRVEVLLDGGDRISGTDLLVATGRRPNLEDLGLEAAGIATGPRGITVDARLRTTNRRVFAIGDVTGGPLFTHAASQQAGIVIRNALFLLPAKADYGALPRVTYTDPELAQVGMTEQEARKSGEPVEVLFAPFAGNDRAQAARRTEGFAKIIVGRRGRILGATIVGPGAGELIGLWALAMSQRLAIGAVAGLVLPYPTLSEISKRAAGSYYTPRLFGPTTRRLVGLIQRFVP
ncbi:dihydrolipoyl dehydrogenase family protein [Phreatobacter oligotrophus]|uniref:Pyruvate/2-oxoglutarate dehydrogenase complex dihydrolipoamide dehydrogenase (E3) component n=1 Tax=Phreatobacter oligotrophus TaxID=1122261 RepID=A0A2T4ZI14_9HYPH|nr:FAD-dependent oxidoreductase [Phreatobacter oligotrophus]PTM61621.1 pyruvate/2-oxoglutarate dehydrogenase complex dihydrolipoamide dehydrogenase (E3) component [Phreatobacter oligotrophus]